MRLRILFSTTVPELDLNQPRSRAARIALWASGSA